MRIRQTFLAAPCRQLTTSSRTHRPPARSAPTPSASPGVAPPSLKTGLAAPIRQPWHKDVVYQIYPRSFSDANGDGIGDLRGILSKLDYLKNLGIDVVWLSPVYKSPQHDNGYDISDYLAIDPTFGTLDDWKALRDGMHARGMKLVMDLVVNHSSNEHPWFMHEVQLKQLQHSLENIKNSLSGIDAYAWLSGLNAHLAGEKIEINEPQALCDAWTKTLLALEQFTAQSQTPLPAGYPGLSAQLANLSLALSFDPETRAQAARNNLDFYLWRDTPNNWTSHFGGPAWHKPEGCGQYYLAEFAPQQPDFNWTNPIMRAAIRDMVHTWIDRGIDGFRMDVIDFIAKDMAFPDEPGAKPSDIGAGARFYMDRPEVHLYLKELAQEIKARGLITVGEVPGVSAASAVRYTGSERGELDQVFLFDHVQVDRQNGRWGENAFHLQDLKRVLENQQHTLHGQGWLANYFENHDQVRSVSRFGDDGVYRNATAKMLATLLFTLEGTPYIYQGQEIGMTNMRFESERDINDVGARNYYQAAVAAGTDVQQVLDVISARSRDNTRTPMQWNAGKNAGFSTHTPWLPVNKNHDRINVKRALQDPASPLHTYRDLIALRRGNDVLLYGDFTLMWPQASHILAFKRRLDDREVTVLLNFSAETQSLPNDDGAVPASSRLLYATAGICDVTGALRPYEARILDTSAAG